MPKPQEAENQAEQHNHPSLETYRAEPLDQPPEAECQAEQATQPELTDRAEQEWQLRGGLGRAEHPWADNNTHPTRQPTTKQVAVGRQVDVPTITINAQILTSCTQDYHITNPHRAEQSL